MPTSGSMRVLSRHLSGGGCVWNEAVQLLPMSCINQPFIELVLHKDLELLPLLPEVVIESKSIWEDEPQQIYSRNTTERLFLVTLQFSLFRAQWQTTSQGLFAVSLTKDSVLTEGNKCMKTRDRSTDRSAHCDLCVGVPVNCIPL